MSKRVIGYIGFMLMTVGFTLSSSCSTVKPYQRAFLNDAEMSFGASHSETLELKSIHYREGSLDLLKGRKSGGCGCR